MTRKLCKIIPNLDPQRTRTLNLTVLQRIDCFIQEIVLTASCVTLYELNVDTCQWSRKDVEGSLFVVKRIAEPRYQFIVMNRRNTENLVENLFGDFIYEVKAPFLLYRNVAQKTNGIWFYDQSELDDVANFFSWVFDPSLNVPQMAKTPSIRSAFEELESGSRMPLVETSQGSSLTTHDKIDPISCSNQAINLVRPSSFASPLLSASFAASPPALQPPPPPPPPSNPSPSALSPSISRNKVRDALVILIQDDKFIDLFYEAMVKACRL